MINFAANQFLKLQTNNFLQIPNSILIIMEHKFYSLKDFEASSEGNILQRAEDFQKYIHQMEQFPHKCYWVESDTGVGASMEIENDPEKVCAFISNDYLGMSQRPETIERELLQCGNMEQGHVLPPLSVGIWTSISSWNSPSLNLSVKKMPFCSLRGLAPIRDYCGRCLEKRHCVY